MVHEVQSVCVSNTLCSFCIKPGACVNQNTSKYADDFSAAARERDRTHPSTIERLSSIAPIVQWYTEDVLKILPYTLRDSTYDCTPTVRIHSANTFASISL